MPAISSLLEHAPSPLEPIVLPAFEDAVLSVLIKRDDLLRMGPDLALCGNKWRKLKYNLAAAQSAGEQQLLTFGGAFSNHIAAVAGAGVAFGFKTTGVIRGEAPQALNPTLRFAKDCGMHLHFVSRSAFRQKDDPHFLAKLQQDFGPFYHLPEGGTNELALEGTREIVKETIQQHPSLQVDYWCVSAGTGGTAAGMILQAAPQSKVLVFSALKGDFLKHDIEGLTGRQAGTGWDLITDFHFGGYARYRPELIGFLNDFYQKYGIALDPVYTGKLFFGLATLARQGYFPKGSTVVAVHTGGLQGVDGFNERFGGLLHYAP
ncbi:MAG: pyridoxal-phosphate dependent enzyme [Phaeodactylibacter sp.]|uniref:1-aminocyclopropane-1-carboxylate deaminase/D-cysteine desulfhydrase n=1 Tax=Phaeodactylibacter sp. TaxID=1940289 RepID=UPI0032EB9796